jgi:hypothetical protein
LIDPWDIFEWVGAILLMILCFTFACFLIALLVRGIIYAFNAPPGSLIRR